MAKSAHTRAHEALKASRDALRASHPDSLIPCPVYWITDFGGPDHPWRVALYGEAGYWGTLSYHRTEVEAILAAAATCDRMAA